MNKPTMINKMKEVQGYPHSNPNPPPNAKIISSKEEAIQQLIYQNSYSKRQLSELMLKTTTPSYLETPNIQQPVNNIVRSPMISNYNSRRNSMQNNINSTNFQHFQNNNFYKNNQQTDQRIRNLRVLSPNNVVQPPKYKRSHRHSIDMCNNVQQKYFEESNQHIMNNVMPITMIQNTRQNLQSSNKMVPSSIKYPKQQSRYMNTNFINSPQQTSTLQDEVYRQKMMKLKSKRSQHSHRLSQQLTPQNQTGKNSVKSPPLMSHQDNRQQLIKAHEVLKAKLNEHIKKENQQKLRNLNNEINYCQSPKISKFQTVNQEKYDNRNQMLKGMKKFPIFTPKKLSKQKQNRELFEQVKTANNISVQQANSRRITQKSQKLINPNNTNNMTPLQTPQAQPKPQQQKKICLRDLKGRVYLDDETQLKTKRTLSKHSIFQNTILTNQQKNTQRNCNKRQMKQTSQKRVNIVQSQMEKVNPESLKKIVSNIAQHNVQASKKMKKNNVYLEDENNNKFTNNNVVKKEPQIDRKIKEPPQPSLIVQKKHQSDKMMVSIEEIHMLQTYEIGNKLTNFYRNNNLNNRNQPVLSSPKSNIPMKNTTMKKQLSNQIYCTQDSRVDIHS